MLSDRDKSSLKASSISVESQCVINLTPSPVPTKNFEDDDDETQPYNRKYRLNQYKFELTPLILGREEFDRNDVPIQFKCTPDTLVNLCAKIVDALPLPSVYEWNIEDICRWLRSYGYPQYQVSAIQTTAISRQTVAIYYPFRQPKQNNMYLLSIHLHCNRFSSLGKI